MLSDDKKRANYDNLPPTPPSQQNFAPNNSSGYQWKNPEFDPNFDHFKNTNWNKFSGANNF